MPFLMPVLSVGTVLLIPLWRDVTLLELDAALLAKNYLELFVMLQILLVESAEMGQSNMPSSNATLLETDADLPAKNLGTPFAT